MLFNDDCIKIMNQLIEGGAKNRFGYYRSTIPYEL